MNIFWISDFGLGIYWETGRKGEEFWIYELRFMNFEL